MGLLQWMRGDDEKATAAMSAGLGAIDELFRPSKHKQTEFIQESRRRRVDVNSSGGIDFDRGIAVIRRPAQATAPAEPQAEPEPE